MSDPATKDEANGAKGSRLQIDWSKASALAAIASLGVSALALWVAYDSAKTTNRISGEALETSRQANQIAMGLAREPAVVEFSSLSSDKLEFNFRTPEILRTELKTIITVKNPGRRPIDALALEFIGVPGLTLQETEPQAQFTALPAFATRLDLYAALQPGALAHVDIRRYVLLYLAKLVPQLPDQRSAYRTVINVVLSPKATNESTPSPAGLSVTKNDRLLIAVWFLPSILEAPEAKQLLASPEVAHRVYAN